MCSRYDELINNSGVEIKLLEVFLYALRGSHGRIICLPPRSRCTFPAFEFSDRNRDSGRPSTIRITVDGVEAPESLTPEQFKRFIKMVFDVDGDGKLTIKGVEAKFSDHLQFWYEKASFWTARIHGEAGRESEHELMNICKYKVEFQPYQFGNSDICLTFIGAGDGDVSAGTYVRRLELRNLWRGTSYVHAGRNPLLPNLPSYPSPVLSDRDTCIY